MLKDLSLMIECLTSLAVTNPLIEPVLRTGSLLKGRPINGVAIAVNVEMFGDKKSYREQVDQLALQIKNLPKAKGVEQIFAPGERGDTILDRRLTGGVPLPDGTLDRLRPISEECGVKLPEPI